MNFELGYIPQQLGGPKGSNQQNPHADLLIPDQFLVSGLLLQFFQSKNRFLIYMQREQDYYDRPILIPRDDVAHTH
jgi:hypothetical protein